MIKQLIFQTFQFSMTTKLNTSWNWYVSHTIQVNINHLWNNQTVLFQTIQFSISTQFRCQTVIFDPSFSDLIRRYQFGSEWTCEWWQRRSTPHSPKLQHWWSFTVRLFRVICRALLRGVFYAEMWSVYSAAPVDWTVKGVVSLEEQELV